MGDVIKILGIETSCDETAASIVNNRKEILSNIIYSQIDFHKEYGGVVPEIASRAHIEKIDMVIEKAFNEAKLSYNEIDAIAVTSGPGLIGGVIVGLMAAKALSASLGKPLICVNHLEGHALTCRLTNNVEFPFLLLLVSGGHCQYIIAKNIGEYEVIGKTLDDSIGEAFDKTSKIMGLGYPGGPILEKMSQTGDQNSFSFPKPLINQNDCNMSFSGLKTSVLREVEKFSGNLPKDKANDIAASFQKTITEVLISKTKKAIKLAKEKSPDISNFVISGGVAANKFINSNLQKTVNDHGFNYYNPPIKLCTDNAAMIAWAGIENFEKGNISDLNYAPRARWSLEDL